MLNHHGKCPAAQAWDIPNVPCSCPPGWPRQEKERTLSEAIAFVESLKLHDNAIAGPIIRQVIEAARRSEAIGEKAWVLTLGRTSGRDKIEGIALSHEDKDEWMRKPFEIGQTRTAMPYKIFRKKEPSNG